MKQRVSKLLAMSLGATNLGALSMIFLFKADDDSAGLCACGGVGIFMLVYLAIIFVVIMGQWKMFVKAANPAGLQLYLFTI